MKDMFEITLSSKCFFLWFTAKLTVFFCDSIISVVLTSLFILRAKNFLTYDLNLTSGSSVSPSLLWDEKPLRFKNSSNCFTSSSLFSEFSISASPVLVTSFTLSVKYRQIFN